MEEHEVENVEVTEYEIYKGEEISFTSYYDYCINADEYLEDEGMIKANNLSMKDAYRRKVGLLTSSEIVKIREKYGVSQKDFATILNWGRATITRYENHQVQDRIHDDVLRKIDSDPKWFLEMLDRAKGELSNKAYLKYCREATRQFKERGSQYLLDYIEAASLEYPSLNIEMKSDFKRNKVAEKVKDFTLDLITTTR